MASIRKSWRAMKTAAMIFALALVGSQARAQEQTRIYARSFDLLPPSRGRPRVVPIRKRRRVGENVPPYPLEGRSPRRRRPRPAPVGENAARARSAPPV